MSGSSLAQVELRARWKRTCALSELNAGGSRCANSQSRVSCAWRSAGSLLPRGVDARLQPDEVGVHEARLLEQRGPQPQALLELRAPEQRCGSCSEPKPPLCGGRDRGRRAPGGCRRPARGRRPSRLRSWFGVEGVCARPASARSVKPSTVSGCSLSARRVSVSLDESVRVEPRRQIALLAGHDPLVVEGEPQALAQEPVRPLRVRRRSSGAPRGSRSR